MSITVRIPTQLRSLTGGANEVHVVAGTVAEAIVELDRTHSGFAGRLLDDSGSLRRFVNLYVGDEDIRFLDGLATRVSEGSQLVIIPAVAGGSGKRSLIDSRLRDGPCTPSGLGLLPFAYICTRNAVQVCYNFSGILVHFQACLNQRSRRAVSRSRMRRFWFPRRPESALVFRR